MKSSGRWSWFGRAARAGLLVPLVAQAAWPSPAADETGYDIAFTATGDGHRGIYVMRGDGSRERLLVDDPSALLMRSSWSPDGQKIAYLCQEGYGEQMKGFLPMHFALCIVNADGSGRRRVLDVAVEPFIAWSSDSQRLAFSTGYEDPARKDPAIGLGNKAVSAAVYVFDFRNGSTIRLTSIGQNRFMSWSPDGHRLAFSGDGGTSPISMDIYVVDSGGGKPQRVTTSSTVDVQPKWSPRGDLIAFVAAPTGLSESAQASGAFVIRPDGSGARRIATILAQDVAWSPDGGRVLVASAEESSGDLLVDLATGTSTELAMGLLGGTFAPDGETILYGSPGGNIYAVDFAGRTRRTLTAGLPFAVSPLRRGKP